MKQLTIILFILCIVEAYFVIDARKERDFYSDSLQFTRNNYINANILDIQLNLKIAKDIEPNPANALTLMNKVLCSGNPFYDSYLGMTSISDSIKTKLQSLKEEVSAYCSINIKKEG